MSTEIIINREPLDFIFSNNHFLHVCQFCLFPTVANQWKITAGCHSRVIGAGDHKCIVSSSDAHGFRIQV